jgi:hypothetical protein
VNELSVGVSVTVLAVGFIRRSVRDIITMVASFTHLFLLQFGFGPCVGLAELCRCVFDCFAFGSITGFDPVGLILPFWVVYMFFV